VVASLCASAALSSGVQYNMDIETARAVLGVSWSDSYDTVRRAFKRLALLNHPDKWRSVDDEATKAFQRINEAWQCIQQGHKASREEELRPFRAHAEATRRTSTDAHAAADQQTTTRRAKDALEQLRREVRLQEDQRHTQEAARRQEEELLRRRRAREEPPNRSTHCTHEQASTAATDTLTEAQQIAIRARVALEQLQRRLHQERQQHHQIFSDWCKPSVEAERGPPECDETGGGGDGEEESLVQRNASARARSALEQLQRGAAAISLQCAARRHLSRRTSRHLQTRRQHPSCLKCPICLEMKAADSLEMTACAHRFCRPCLESWIVGQAQATCPICRTGLRVDRSAQAVPVLETEGEAVPLEDESDSEWEDALEDVEDGSDAPKETKALPRESPTLHKTRYGADVQKRPPLSIICKLHQAGYDKKAAAAAMFALELPALDWTEHDLRRAVAHLELS